MSKKIKISILICFVVFSGFVFVFLKEKKAQAPTLPFFRENKPENDSKNNSEKEYLNFKAEEDSTVYHFMQKLQNDKKINFTSSTYAGMGEFIDEINGIKNAKKNWIYYVNGEKAKIGISNYKLNKGDILTWKYEDYN